MFSSCLLRLIHLFQNRNQDFFDSAKMTARFFAFSDSFSMNFEALISNYVKIMITKTDHNVFVLK